MDPADRRARRSSLRRLRPLDAFVVVALCALALGLAMPWLGLRWPGGAGSSSSRLGGMTGEEAVLDALIEVANEKALEHVVFQLAVEPGDDLAWWPDPAVPWGHVPEVTMFDDGTGIFVVRDDIDSPKVDAVEFDQADMERLVDEVLAPQFDRLTREEPSSDVDGDWELRSRLDVGSVTVRLRRDGRLASARFDENVHRLSEDAGKALSELVMAKDFFYRADQAPLSSTASILYDVTASLVASRLVPTAFERLYAPWRFDAEAYPGDIGAYESHRPGFSPVAWPTGVSVPERFPALFSGEALWALRDALLGATVFDGAEDAMLREGDGGPVREVVGYWAWSFDLPDGAARVAAVPWIYGDRYPDVERDIEAYARALEAAEVARRDADETAIAAEHADRGPSDLMATMEAKARTYPYDDAYGDPIVPTPPWNPFPPEVSPDPLAFGLGIQTWQHWLPAPDALEPLTSEFTPRFEWLKQRFAWADLEPYGPTLLDANDLLMHPDGWFDGITAGSRTIPPRVLIQLDVPPEWARNASPDAGDPPFDMTAWSGFVREFASRYAGQVDAYEIMNEPNLAREWGAEPDPAAYAKVLAAAYRAIKMADPHAVVVSAGLAPTGTELPEAMADDVFLEQLYAAMDAEGGSALHFDALGAHAPGFAAAPSVSPDEAAADPALGGQRTFTFRRVEDLRRIMVEHGDEAKQIVVTEFGWTTDARPDSPYAWSAVTADERAEHIRDARDFARDNWAPWIGPLILFTAADPAWTPDHEAWWWSVTEPGGGLRQEIRDAFAGD